MADLCPFEVTPLATVKQSKVSTSMLYSLNYTSQDYWSMKGRALDLLKQKFPQDFNEFTESSLAVMMIEVWSFLADTLSFKIDQNANEIFPDSVTEPENAIRLAKFLGYTPTPPLPARTMFTGSLNHVLTTDLSLQTPVVISYNTPAGVEKTMELFAADHNNNPLFGQSIVIPAGSVNTKSIVGIEGRTLSAGFTSNGMPNQTFTMTGKPCLLGSVRVLVNGVEWEWVDCFSNGPQNEFLLEHDSIYRGTIRFGDNKAGKIPPKGASILVNYRVGGGSDGNVSTGGIDQTITAYMPGVSYMVSVQFRNYTKGEFGYDGDTVDDIRRKLSIHLKTQNRAVTGLDYKFLAERFATPYNGKVGKANVVLRHAGCAGNIIDMFILSNDGDSLSRPSQSLKEELLEEIGKKKMITDHVCLHDGEIILVDIVVELTIDKSFRRNEEVIRDKTLRRMDWFFTVSNWDFGQTLKENDIIKLLADVEEISNCNASFTTVKSLESQQGSANVVTANYYEIIRPDNIQINFNYKSSEEI